MYQYGKNHGKVRKEVATLDDPVSHDKKYLKLYEIEDFENNSVMLVGSTQDFEEIKDNTMAKCFYQLMFMQEHILILSGIRQVV